MMADPITYEGLIHSANFPTMTIAFTAREGEAAFAGGVYQITRIRTATAADFKTFPKAPVGCCPLCGQEELL